MSWFAIRTILFKRLVELLIENLKFNVSLSFFQNADKIILVWQTSENVI